MSEHNPEDKDKAEAKMVIKSNPYSDQLADALRIVSEIKNPCYTTAPIDPTDEMLDAARDSTDISREKAREMYMTMILAWAKTH
jgi:hypothetical protein